MKKIFQRIYILLLFCLLLSSCSVTTSIPNVINVPMFQKEKEFQTAGYIGTDHSELQMAYSLDSVKGVMLNSYAGYGENTPFLKTYFLEGGYGFRKGLKDKTKIELFGGYGYGRKNYYDHYTYRRTFLFTTLEYGEILYDIKNRFHRLFVQANIGTKLGKKPDSKSAFAFSLRAMWLFYSRYNLLYEKYDLDQNYFIPIEKDFAELRYKNAFLLEPAFTFRFGLGFPPVYFIYQPSAQIFVSGNSHIKKYTFSKYFMRLGIYVIIDHK